MAATPPTRPALRARYDFKQQAVIDHAAREFADRGFHATSMQDLVDATGLAAGGLYHYFASKDELLVMICDALMEPLLAEIRAIIEHGSPPRVQLTAIVRVWMAHVEAHTDHMRVFQQERHALEHGPQWRRVRRQRKDFEGLVAGVIAQGQTSRDFDFADPDLALRALLGMVNHTAAWYRQRGRLSVGQIADGYVDLLLGVRGRGELLRL